MEQTPKYAGGAARTHAKDNHREKPSARRKISSKKITVTYNFSEAGCAFADVECEDRDLQELLKQCDLTPDLREAGRRAAYEQLVDEEFCRKLTGKFARKSARKTGTDIREIQDIYDILVMEFLATRHTSPADRQQQSLSSLLRKDYETDKALKAFLAELGEWIGGYVSRCISRAPQYNWKRKGSDVRAIEGLRGYAVSEEMMTALALEYVRDREGLVQFLEAVFKHWRKLFDPHSRWRVRLIVQKHQSEVPHHQIIQNLKKAGAVSKRSADPTTTNYALLRSKIKQYRSRDGKRLRALKKR